MVALLKGVDLPGVAFPGGGTSVWGAEPVRRHSWPHLHSYSTM